MQYGGVGPLVSTDVLPHYCNVAICVFKKCRVEIYRAKRDEVTFLRQKVHSSAKNLEYVNKSLTGSALTSEKPGCQAVLPSSKIVASQTKR